MIVKGAQRRRCPDRLARPPAMLTVGVHLLEERMKRHNEVALTSGRPWARTDQFLFSSKRESDDGGQ